MCLRLSLLALGSALTYRLDNQLVGDELQCGAIPVDTTTTYASFVALVEVGTEGGQ